MFLMEIEGELQILNFFFLNLKIIRTFIKIDKILIVK